MKTLKQFLFLFLAIVLLLILFEIVLGAFFMVKDRNLCRNEVRDYPYLYYLFKETDDTDHYGFKTKYRQDKAEGVYRIVLIGGSVARGREPETSIAAYLEKELNTENQGLKFEVVNAGISAFVVEQEFLLVQLILQDFHPDLVISLDGYNDLLTYKINLLNNSPFILPPHNWQVFQVIGENETQRKFYSRFSYLFRNIHRMYNFYQRTLKKSSFDLNEVSNEQLNKVNDTYWNVVRDTRDFCKVKGIEYLHFLQPVKFHLFSDKTDNGNDYEKLMTQLYSLFDSTAASCPYAQTLSDVLDGYETLYIDQCHVKNEGHALIATKMATDIRKRFMPGVKLEVVDSNTTSTDFFKTE